MSHNESNVRPLFTSVATIVVCSLGVATAHGATPADSVRHFDIDSQMLSLALGEFASQSDRQILFATEVVDARRTGGIKGELEPEAALRQLLKGTGLTYRVNADETILVESAAKVEQISERRDVSPRFRLAQAESAAGPGSTTSTASEGGFAQLEEIIVTATKRAERLVDVPISIGVVTSEDIDRRGLVSAEDYLRGMPGVTQAGNGLYGETIVIRGLETARQSANRVTGTTVATYFGETPTTTSRGISGGSNIDIKLVDIERVEVLRGPQGTAFGSSAIGGAVRTIPVAPKLNSLEAKVAANYAHTSGAGGDSNMIQGVSNIPLIDDRLALRVVGYRYENAGYYKNVAGSGSANTTFRTAVVDRFSLQDFARDEDNAGTSRFIGGRAAALFQASDKLKFTFSYLKQNIEQDGVPVQTSGDFEQTVLQVAPEHRHRGQAGVTNDAHIDIANATGSYDFGWADLLATYSYTSSGSTPVFAGTALNDLSATGAASSSPVNEQRGRYSEVRLSTKLEGAWNFLGGFYAEDVDDQALWTYYWVADPATQPATYPHIRFLGGDDIRRTLKQRAAFTEVSWEFLPRFTLTGGARYYDYDRTEVRNTRGFFFGTATTPREKEAADATFRGNLSFKPMEDALVYASWSQGFRLGATQAGLPAGTCDTNGDGIVDNTSLALASTRNTESDTAVNYEIGSKLVLLERRVNLTADVFRIDWDNLPASVGPPPGAPCSGLYAANVGTARSEGVEFQANFLLTRAFSVDLGASYTHARLTKDAAPGGVLIKAGTTLPVPEYNANLGLQYEFKTRGYPAFVRLDSTYVGTYFGSLTQQSLTQAGGYTKLDATARVGLLRNLSADLFVRNLTNRDDFTFRSNGLTGAGAFYGYRLQPRTVGLQLGYTF